MNETNIVLIKLMTGENIVCETLEDCDSYVEKKFIDVHNPVLVNVMRMPRGTNLIESYLMMPWLGFAKTEFCRIFSDKIVTLVDVEDGIRDNYIEFVERREQEKEEEESEDDDTNVKFSESSNEADMEIEEFLEKAIEKIGEHLEEDEEYDGREDFYFGRVRRSTRTLH
jgi:hypothetical protein